MTAIESELTILGTVAVVSLILILGLCLIGYLDNSRK
jgi:hypothetical protein